MNTINDMEIMTIILKKADQDYSLDHVGNTLIIDVFLKDKVLELKFDIMGNFIGLNHHTNYDSIP